MIHLACGIIAVASRRGVLKKRLGEVVREALKRLEYRGYDSVGFAILTHEGRLVVRKSMGMIDSVSRKLGFSSYDGLIGIGHTRWATHGPPNDVNSHPHLDCSGKIAVAHNGIIENWAELRNRLAEKGHKFISDTDTEVVPHLIEELKKEGLGPYEAFKSAVSMLKGAFAIVAIDKDEPDKVFFARQTSPLVVGFGEGVNFIASDIPAFLEYTRRIMVVNDGELGYVSADSVVLERAFSGAEGIVWESVDYRDRIRVIEWTVEMAMKSGYPHFMLKEIHEQPQALASTLSGVWDEAQKVARIIDKADRVLILGAGTSYHASYLGAIMMNNISKIWAHPLISSEFSWYINSLEEGNVVIAVSQSGETIDTLLAIREAKKRGALTISISNVVDSAIPRESHISIYTRAGPEIGVAATKTFTTQVAVLSALALALANRRKVLQQEEFERHYTYLRQLPDLVSSVISKHEGRMRAVSKKMVSKHSAFFLGRGYGLPLSLEGALKLKEIAYIHAEAYPAGESKHGPIALVEEGFPVYFTAVQEEDGEMIRSNIQEMKARFAWTLAVAPHNMEEVLSSVDVPIKMPAVPVTSAVVAYIVPAQLLAYYTAVRKGYDPDKPRNLAKTVTVV